jgi:hypothetical protein
MQPPPLTIAGVANDAVLDRAFMWLCKQRKEWPAEADVWDFRRLCRRILICIFDETVNAG